MKWLVDTNVLYPALDSSHPDHAAMRTWLDKAKPAGWGITVETFLGTIRTLMNPVIMRNNPLKSRDAVGITRREVSGQHPGQIIGGKPDDKLLEKARGHKQIMDIYLAQVARDNGANLVTLDNGILSAFPKIAVRPS
jgi:predicted nucleic acid-binding protein